MIGNPGLTTGNFWRIARGYRWRQYKCCKQPFLWWWSPASEPWPKSLGPYLSHWCGSSSIRSWIRSTCLPTKQLRRLPRRVFATTIVKIIVISSLFLRYILSFHLTFVFFTRATLRHITYTWYVCISMYDVDQTHIYVNVYTEKKMNIIVKPLDYPINTERKRTFLLRH